MRLMVLLVFIFAICSGIYLLITYLFLHFKELKKVNWIAFGISAFTGLCLIVLIGFAIYSGSKRGDTWCSTIHVTTAYPPMHSITAMDFFEKGNYEYDQGKCLEAIADYSQSVEINPTYPQAFNNRAYTYMKMEKYDLAVADLDKALALNPNYTHALRNRADVNTYRMNNKTAAVADYQKLIEINGPSTDVCAHLADAKNDSKSILSFIGTIRSTINCTRGK